MLIEILNWDNVDINQKEIHTKNISWHIDVLREIIDYFNFKTMVEVGTFLGSTACRLANLLDKLYTVDIFNFEYMRKHFPMDKLQDQFLRNTFPVSHKIIPIKGISWEVGELFKKLGIKVDLVYIDADHHYEAVKKDLKAWYGVGKVMCGDDYITPHHKAVVKAVNEFALEHNLKVVNIDKNFWYYE